MLFQMNAKPTPFTISLSSTGDIRAYCAYTKKGKSIRLFLLGNLLVAAHFFRSCCCKYEITTLNTSIAVDSSRQQERGRKKGKKPSQKKPTDINKSCWTINKFHRTADKHRIEFKLLPRVLYNRKKSITS